MTMTPGIPDPSAMPASADGRQWVVLVWRDKKIQAQSIPESDIPIRFKNYDHLDLLLDFVKTAVPGDSFPVKGERLLRSR